ncbi:MAG: methyltransferase domain-containing protein [Acidimicrobiales bacterium]|nr:class I SAM-dependent methyltransferase [Actinomycetota bacterium]
MSVCPACGMGSLGRREHDKDYWQRNADPKAALADDFWTNAKSGVFRSALQLLGRQGGPGRLVDLGGGVGHFAELALDLGWDAYSIDVAPLAAEAAAERLGAERSFTTPPPGLTGICDAVTLWCVIAHVDDPGALIKEALNLLRPGGRLLLTTPNFRFQRPYARFLARIGRPVDFVALEHYLHFSPSALDRVLSDSGAASWRYEYVGVTESCCGMEGRFTRFVVPAKKVWNRSAVAFSRLGRDSLCSELQVVAVKASPAGAGTVAPRGRMP